MALTKFNFNSFDVTTAASSGLAFNASANGFTTAAAGALNLIATNTITSGVSSSSFTSGITSTYDTYLFKLISVHTSGDNIDFQFQGSTDSGSNYNTTITSTFFRSEQDEGGSSTELAYKTGRDLAQSTSFKTLIGGPGNDNDQSTSGSLYLFAPSSTTFVKHFFGSFHTSTYNNIARTSYVGGYFNTTSAIDAIQFKGASGNFDSGVIKMYGITK